MKKFVIILGLACQEMGLFGAAAAEADTPAFTLLRTTDAVPKNILDYLQGELDSFRGTFHDCSFDLSGGAGSFVAIRLSHTSFVVNNATAKYYCMHFSFSAGRCYRSDHSPLFEYLQPIAAYLVITTPSKTLKGRYKKTKEEDSILTKIEELGPDAVKAYTHVKGILDGYWRSWNLPSK